MFVSHHTYLLTSSPPKTIASGGGALLMGVLIKETHRGPLPPPPREDTAPRPGYEQGQGTPQEVSTPAPWSWTAQPPELWEITGCCWKATRFLDLYYRNTNRLSLSAFFRNKNHFWVMHKSNPIFLALRSQRCHKESTGVPAESKKESK